MDSYFTNRELTRPYTSGKMMADLTLEEISKLPADLTDAERTSPFAKYYDEPLAELQPQMKEAVEKGPLSEEEMYMPSEAGPILLGGSKNYPLNGYGVLANGVGYSTSLMHYDNITDEMIAWYRDHFAVTEDPAVRTLFYKTWYPGKHLIHFEDGIVEDFGWGYCLQEMNWDIFNMQSHFGVKKEDIPRLDPDCIAVTGLGGKCTLVSDPSDNSYTCMIQYTKQTKTGRDLCVHYWNGVRLYPDGRIEVAPNVGREEMQERMKNMMLHAMQEDCNEKKHIEEFWNETHQ